VDDEGIVTVTPAHRPEAAVIWIQVPGSDRALTLGAGSDFRADLRPQREILDLVEGIAGGGFVEQVYRRRDRVAGTRGCVTLRPGEKAVCKVTGLARLPRALLSRLGVRVEVVRYPPY